MDYLLGLETEWTRWLAEGTSTMTKTAHPVETDSAGIARLWGLRLGDGSATGLNATEKLTVIGDGTQRAVDIDVPASGLEGIAITSDSDVAPALTIASTGTQGAAFLDASGSSNPTLEVISTTQSAISATSTDAPAIVAEATGSLTECAIKGTGDVCGVVGVAVGGGGTGVSGTTASGASTSAEGVRGIGLGDGAGGRFSAVDGPAVEASATGEQDAVVVPASGDGAAARFDPQAVPAVDRAGQLYMLDVDANRCAPMACCDATGLGPGQQYIPFSNYPVIMGFDETNGSTNVAQGAVNTHVQTLTVSNPYGTTVRIRVQARATFVPNALGTIPLAACTVTLFDVTAGTVLETDSFTFANSTHRTGFTIEAAYDMPSTSSTQFALRVSVAAGTPGDQIAVSHRKLAVMMHTAGLS